MLSGDSRKLLHYDSIEKITQYNVYVHPDNMNKTLQIILALRIGIFIGTTLYPHLLRAALGAKSIIRPATQEEKQAQRDRDLLAITQAQKNELTGAKNAYNDANAVI
jgi:hypothetical protein